MAFSAFYISFFGIVTLPIVLTPIKIDCKIFTIQYSKTIDANYYYLRTTTYHQYRISVFGFEIMNFGF